MHQQWHYRTYFLFWVYFECYWYYADDTPLFISVSAPDFSQNIYRLETTIDTVSAWMSANLLLLNQPKTEFLLIGLPKQLSKYLIPLFSCLLMSSLLLLTLHVISVSLSTHHLLCLIIFHPGASERGDGGSTRAPAKMIGGQCMYLSPLLKWSVHIDLQQSQPCRQMGATLQPNTMQFWLKVSLIRLLEFYVNR